MFWSYTLVEFEENQFLCNEIILENSKNFEWNRKSIDRIQNISIKFEKILNSNSKVPVRTLEISFEIQNIHNLFKKIYIN